MPTLNPSTVLARPDRFIPILSFAVGASLAVYVVLVVTTILFAAWQTQEVSLIRTTEGTISQLESSYYAQVAQVDAIQPASLGFVAPHQVQYVQAQMSDPGLTFNGN